MKIWCRLLAFESSCCSTHYCVPPSRSGQVQPKFLLNNESYLHKMLKTGKSRVSVQIMVAFYINEGLMLALLGNVISCNVIAY